MNEKGTNSKPYHHGDLRNKLIRVGLEILTQEGAAALSLRKTARRAGVSHAAPYRHFADKDALIIAIAEDGFQRLSQKMAEQIAQHPDEPLLQFQGAGYAYIQFALENPEHLRIMFSGIPNDKRRCVNDANSFDLLLETIQACQAGGYIQAGDAMQMALFAWSQVHGLATLLIGESVPQSLLDVYTQEELVQFCLQNLYDGLVPR